MMLLGMDTTTPNLVLGLQRGPLFLDGFSTNFNISHSKNLLLEINKILKHHKLKIKDIDALCVGVGPGSFTGLRVGLATAKAFNICAGVKLVPVPSIDVIAQNALIANVNFLAEKIKYICVIIDAKKEKVYSSIYIYKNGEIVRKSKYMLVSVEELSKYIDDKAVIIGDGLKIYGQKIFTKIRNPIILEESFWYPQALFLMKMGFKYFSKGIKTNSLNIRPLYLHPDECNVRKKNKL